MRQTEFRSLVDFGDDFKVPGNIGYLKSLGIWPRRHRRRTWAALIYHSDTEKASAAMRPSVTLNAIVDGI